MKIKKQTNQRVQIRFQKKKRIQKKLQRQHDPMVRLIPFRSNKFLYVQVVDPNTQKTIVQANTKEKDFESLSSKKGIDAGLALGKLIGQRAKEKKVDKIFFDRNGYDYHGRVKAIADGAREAGLKF